MSNSEILYTFNEKRNEFKPYGLTCELWKPSHVLPLKQTDRSPIQTGEINKVEQIALYIAFECGFNSINRFNAAFRKINKCTPREFKKKYGSI